MPKLTSLLVCLCLLFYACSAQKVAPPKAATDQLTTATTDSLSFPESWMGVWEGQLSIYSVKGLAQQLPMELHILATDSTDRFIWRLVYGEDKEAGARNYELVVKDRAKGLYVVDELNSIQLECYLINGKLFSWYLVEDILIMITNEVRGEEMVFEVIAGSHTPVSITGEGEIEGEEISPVSTYPVRSSQKAILTRKK